jgi:hypothetical protein
MNTPVAVSKLNGVRQVARRQPVKSGTFLKKGAKSTD